MKSEERRVKNLCAKVVLAKKGNNAFGFFTLNFPVAIANA